VYYGKPLHKETLVKSRRASFWEVVRVEQGATPVRLSTDKKVRSICNVDKQEKKKIGSGRKKENNIEGITEGMYVQSEVGNRYSLSTVSRKHERSLGGAGSKKGREGASK